MELYLRQKHASVCKLEDLAQRVVIEPGVEAHCLNREVYKHETLGAADRKRTLNPKRIASAP